MALSDYNFLVGLISTFIITSSYEVSSYIIKQVICIARKSKITKHNDT